MRPIDHNDTLLYFEEETGFLYKKKKYSGADYFSPLNFCTLECTPKKDNHGNTINTVKEAIQEHTGNIQLRREPKRQPARWGLRPYVSLRDRTPRRVQVLFNQCSHGIGTVHNKNIRRNCVHSILGTSPTTRVYGIGPRVRTKNNPIRKEEARKKEIRFPISHGTRKF